MTKVLLGLIAALCIGLGITGYALKGAINDLGVMRQANATLSQTIADNEAVYAVLNAAQIAEIARFKRAQAVSNSLIAESLMLERMLRGELGVVKQKLVEAISHDEKAVDWSTTPVPDVVIDGMHATAAEAGHKIKGSGNDAHGSGDNPGGHAASLRCGAVDDEGVEEHRPGCGEHAALHRAIGMQQAIPSTANLAASSAEG